MLAFFFAAAGPDEEGEEGEEGAGGGGIRLPGRQGNRNKNNNNRNNNNNRKRTERGNNSRNEGEGDNSEGEVRLLLELKVDDIVDWLWEELKLPDLQPKPKTTLSEDEFVREGWDRRGARARLDRRRTVKEAVRPTTYLKAHGRPKKPADLSRHDALIYSSVQGDERWQLTGGDGQRASVPVRGHLRSNNLSMLLAAARQGFGIAALPRYVAHESLQRKVVVSVLDDWHLPHQEVHAVFPSPRFVPAKVKLFISWLQGQFGPQWWATLNEGAS